MVSRKQAEVGCSVLNEDWVTAALKEGMESESLGLLARWLQT